MSKLLKKTKILYHFNNALPSFSFPTDALKYAYVRASFKKDNKTSKENYRPISILSPKFK